MQAVMASPIASTQMLRPVVVPGNEYDWLSPGQRACRGTLVRHRRVRVDTAVPLAASAATLGGDWDHGFQFPAALHLARRALCSWVRCGVPALEYVAGGSGPRPRGSIAGGSARKKQPDLWQVLGKFGSS